MTVKGVNWARYDGVILHDASERLEVPVSASHVLVSFAVDDPPYILTESVACDSVATVGPVMVFSGEVFPVKILIMPHDHATMLINGLSGALTAEDEALLERLRGTMH